MYGNGRGFTLTLKKGPEGVKRKKTKGEIVFIDGPVTGIILRGFMACD